MSFGLYLVFVVLLYLRPVEAFAPELAAYRPMLVLSLTTLAVSIATALAGGDSALRRQYVALLFSFVAAIAVSQISVGWAGGAMTSMIDFSVSATLFLVTLINVTNLRRLRLTCLVLAGCIVVLSAASVAAYHTGFMADRLLLQQASNEESDMIVAEPDSTPADDNSGAYLWRVRSLGFFADPNDFAQGIVVALPLLLGLYVRRRALRDLLLLGPPATVLLYALFLTHSRGALVGVVAMLFFACQRALGATRTAILVICTVGAALALNFTGGRMYTANEESAGGRIDAWAEGIRMFASHPVFGVGYHNFTEHYIYTAHNSYVLCFAELGLVGYFLWVGMLVVAMRKINQSAALAPPDSGERRWTAVLAAAMVGFLACALFLSRTYEPLLFHLLGLCLAAAYCTQRTIGAEDSAKLQMPARWAGVATVLALGSVALVYAIVVIKTATIGTSI